MANGVIKVADFGLVENMYGTNYYRRSKSEDEEKVPIRWMAPESIETNIYNEATDVVSLKSARISIIEGVDNLLFTIAISLQSSCMIT